MYDYPGIERGDLPLQKDQKVTVFDDSRDHWWRARNEKGYYYNHTLVSFQVFVLLCFSQEGFIPSNYVKKFGLDSEE